ncbi:MAG TPA: heavy metal translocating P-type ATPase [Gaiellaceae bacterium]|nr:heavy metal translocating P-type ATPase [Gaiellaceae bacterium]
METAVGLTLALVSAVLVNWAYSKEHDAAAAMPRFSPRRPLEFIRLLLADRFWVRAFATESVGWSIYVAALALAPLSLVQAVCASGIAVLALVSVHGHPRRLARHEQLAVAVAFAGLVLLSLSLVDTHQADHPPHPAALAVWLGSLLAVAVVLGRRHAGLAVGPALGLAAGLLFAGGDISAKLVVYGGPWLGAVATLIVFYGLGTSVLQGSFQNGNALTGAGLATLATNAVPIAAGFVVFGEQLPQGTKGGLQLAAFSLLVLSGALLASVARPGAAGTQSPTLRLSLDGLRAHSRRLVAAAALAGVLGGIVLWAVDRRSAADWLWAATTALLLVPLGVSVLRSLLRRDVGVDAVALVAMAGALALGEYLAGAVIALMLAGGNALEEAANRRARRELTALVERAPRVALVRRGDGLHEVPVDEVEVGDHVLVRPGEVVPVDGMVDSGEAIVDESALTGEPLPVTVHRGGQVRSGTTSAGSAFELSAIRPAAESAYAALVRLVEQAEQERAPFVRLADRYAAIFLPVTAVVAGVAWAVSGDPVRALAVFVVATPCPLILAAPIALMSGLSRCARAGVVVKGAGTIEQLGEAHSVLLDKTGTVTLGHPELERLVPLDGLDPNETLRLAASVDRLSAHPLAHALVAGADAKGLRLGVPEHVEESFGHGVSGAVQGHEVLVGSRRWLSEHGVDAKVPEQLDGSAKVLVAVDGKASGVALIGDHLRTDADRLVPRLRAAGIRHVALVTGDKTAVAERVGETLGVDRVYAEQTPDEKLEIVRALQALPDLRSIVMVGDGINDAPALALADVGVAMGSAGATVSSETADAVVLVDRVDRIADAIRISRRALHIAVQSVMLGMGASLIAMGFAAAGYLPPVAGALLQEGIDVAVILNALRALTDSPEAHS